MKITEKGRPALGGRVTSICATAVLLSLGLLQACHRASGASAQPAPAPAPAPPAAPEIKHFAGNATAIQAGQSVTLEADFQDGTAVLKPGDLPLASGVPIQVTPSRTTTYVLSVTNAAGVTSLQTDSIAVTPAVSGMAQLAGQLSGLGNADGQGSLARFSMPMGVAVDGAGNLYVADQNKLRKLTPDGQVSTLAGGDEAGFSDGQGATARFRSLGDLGLDKAGNIYACDMDNNVIRKITPAGLVSTLAGGSVGSADGVGPNAQFKRPAGLVVDDKGTVFVADYFSDTIRAITADGTVTTLAGLAGSAGLQDGTGAAARFSGPWGLALDGAGNIYVSEYFNRVLRRVTPAGEVSTVPKVTFASPGKIGLDAYGNLYATDSSVIRKLAGHGTLGILAGNEDATGAADGTGAAATFSSPSGLALDGYGNIYVTDASTMEVRKITPEGDVSTFAGCARTVGDWADGVGASVGFNSPKGLAVDGAGNTYVADVYNHVIRMILPTGQTTTLAGQPGQGGFADGPADQALFYQPTAVAADGQGNVYVLDFGNDLMRKITPQGMVSTLAGTLRQWGQRDGTGTDAQFSFWRGSGLVLDGAGNLYVTTLDAVRRIDPTGVVTTLAGSGDRGYADGVGAAARFAVPAGIALDGAGILYVADSLNGVIRAITPAGVVSTLAGSKGSFGGQDGQGAAASFSVNMQGLTCDGAGHLYLADDATVRRISTRDGTVTTVVGSRAVTGTVPGPLPASLLQTTGLAWDPAGHLLLSVPDAVMRVTF